MTDSLHEENKSAQSFMKYLQTSGCTKPTATQDTPDVQCQYPRQNCAPPNRLKC